MEQNQPATTTARYRYFVAYMYTNGYNTGQAWTQVSMAHPIRNENDLRAVQTALMQNNRDYTSLTITGWQRFED